jgi:hypothetical protein
MTDIATNTQNSSSLLGWSHHHMAYVTDVTREMFLVIK